ncbi:MAG TPA: YncE family protein [Verrucomicrobiae bacterium]|jgi:DNA-binding beta-propeller fold protein YncE|nr:YncE family protein [Verrucomicrobiae bacterium]
MNLKLVCLFALAIPAMSANAQPQESSTTKSGLLLVCNKGEHTLGLVDPVEGKQLAVVEENGITGHEVIASADGKLAFVPIYGNSGVGHPGTDGEIIRVIDLEKRAIVGTVDFGRGLRPHCAMIGPKNDLLYVTTELTNSIAVIDPKTFKILDFIPTGQSESHMLAISPQGRYGYTANVGPGTVSVIDLQEKKVEKIIPISKETQRIAISPDDKWVFTADQTQPRLAVIDTEKREVSRWIELPGMGYGTAPTPDGNWLVVALPGIKQVAFVDLKTMKVAHTVDVPRSPQEVLIRPDGKIAYVSCDASRQVAAIDTQNFQVEKLINTGKGADGLAWAP